MAILKGQTENQKKYLEDSATWHIITSACHSYQINRFEDSLEMLNHKFIRLLCLLGMVLLLYCPIIRGDEAGIAKPTDNGSTSEITSDGDNSKDRKKSAKKKTTKDWSKIKEDTLEKEWEGGDEEEELEVFVF